DLGKFLIDQATYLVEKITVRVRWQMVASQTEFPMSVAVCAWCKPRERHETLGLLSHGICPRHLRLMKLQAKGINPRRNRSAKVSDPDRERMLLPGTDEVKT